jgi:hypothetical protein
MQNFRKRRDSQMSRMSKSNRKSSLRSNIKAKQKENFKKMSGTELTKKELERRNSNELQVMKTY